MNIELFAMSPILCTCVTVHLNFGLKAETLLEFGFKECLPYSITIGASLHLDVLKANRLYRLLAANEAAK